MKQIRYVKLENPDGTYSDAIPFSTDSDHIDDTTSAHKFTTTAEKISWNNKYMKPTTGIPSTDLSQAVLNSLEKAENAVQTSALAGFSSIQVVSKLPTVEQNGVLYLVTDDGSLQNLIDLNTNCTLVDERAAHLVNSSNKLTVNVIAHWSRTTCTVTGLAPNSYYTVVANILNTSELFCGLYVDSDNKDMGTDISMSKSITLSSNGNGELYFEFYANLGDVADTGVVVFDNIELYANDAPVENLYPDQGEGHVKVDGFTVAMTGRQIMIDGRNDNTSVWGWVPQFSGMDLEANKTYYLQLVNTGGSFDDSARVSGSDGVVVEISLETYDSEGVAEEKLLDKVEKARNEVYDKIYFTPTSSHARYGLSIAAKKLVIFDNWTCNIIIAEDK